MGNKRTLRWFFFGYTDGSHSIVGLIFRLILTIAVILYIVIDVIKMEQEESSPPTYTAKQLRIADSINRHFIDSFLIPHMNRNTVSRAHKPAAQKSNVPVYSSEAIALEKGRIARYDDSLRMLSELRRLRIIANKKADSLRLALQSLPLVHNGPSSSNKPPKQKDHVAPTYSSRGGVSHSLPIIPGEVLVRRGQKQ